MRKLEGTVKEVEENEEDDSLTTVDVRVGKKTHTVYLSQILGVIEEGTDG